MKGSLITVLVIAGLGVLGVGYTIGVYNDFARQENGIVAVHENLQNVHASIFNQIKSQGLSVEKYGSMVIQAIQAAIGGRYGDKGAQGAMLWIREQNPTIDPSIIAKLQVAIEAGYNKFEAAQSTKIDKIRILDNALDTFPRGSIGKMFGYPKKVTADMRVTITSAETKEMMKTKEMKTIDPFSKQ